MILLREGPESLPRYTKNKRHATLEQAMKILRIGLILCYPVIAVLIWFLPIFEHTPQWNKVVLSIILVLYAALRVYRVVRRRNAGEES